MGIKVPAGECNIEFNYVTPGLKAGVVCTVGAAFIIVLYYIVLKRYSDISRTPMFICTNSSSLISL